MKSILLLLAVVGTPPEPQPQLLIPGAPLATVQWAVSCGDQPAQQGWVEFLDHWRAMFDSNGDGTLNATEATQVPTLTSSSGTSIRLDIQAADFDKDGLASRDEILTYYRSRELTAIHTPPVQNDLPAIQASVTLWKLLDTDRDGRLSQSELGAAAQLLNRWDLNEDECLAFDELPPPVVAGHFPNPNVSWLRNPKEIAEATDIQTIPIALDSLKNPHPLDRNRVLPSSLKQLDRQRLRLDLPVAKVTILLGESSAQRIAAAQQYLLAEINLARGDRAALQIAAIKEDPNLEWLAAFASAADRNRDMQLDEGELNSVVALLAEGAAAQITLNASLRGHNLFDALDTNSDNQLDLRELIAAVHLKPLVSEPDRLLASDDLPLSIVVKIQRGPSSGRFGRLRIARRPAEATSKEVPSTHQPRWFAAMDRNRDRVLSPDEFLGTPAQFSRLDRNSDGVISDDESQ